MCQVSDIRWWKDIGSHEAANTGSLLVVVVHLLLGHQLAPQRSGLVQFSPWERRSPGGQGLGTRGLEAVETSPRSWRQPGTPACKSAHQITCSPTSPTSPGTPGCQCRRCKQTRCFVVSDVFTQVMRKRRRAEGRWRVSQDYDDHPQHL